MLELKKRQHLLRQHPGSARDFPDASKGEIVTLIGANGAGKSTTLMSICGGVPPRSGEFFSTDSASTAMKADRIVRMGISQVPEGRLIFPDMSVMENLDLGAFLRNDKDGIRKDLDYVFELFPILAERRKQMGGTLSGGEQQMLAISRALMARPGCCCWTSRPWAWPHHHRTDFRHHPEGQRNRNHRVSGGAERQPGA
jgi:ABC-type lipopolysaccharide export system ATPase subunit